VARPKITTPGVEAAVQYAKDVLAGEVVTCALTKLSCKRFLDDLEAAGVGESRWEFRPDLAERPMLFASLLSNIKGPEAGKPLRLMSWQRFIFANIFGFVERGTDTRRFRQALVWCPRGSGKTTLAAPIALFLTFVDGEGGAEGYAAAVTRDQARILFDTAKEMVKRSPDFRSRFGVEVGANAVFQPKTASKFVPVSSDAKALDGLNVQVAVCDEIGSHKTSEVYDVLMTAMGKRKHPLQLSISTATGNSSGIGKQLWDYGVRVLELCSTPSTPRTTLGTRLCGSRPIHPGARLYSRTPSGRSCSRRGTTPRRRLRPRPVTSISGLARTKPYSACGPGALVVTQR
jgi:phage terminase large subunit-like protein